VVLIMKIRKKAILKKITKMVKDEEVEEVMKRVVGLKVVVEVMKRVKLKVMEMKIIEEVMVKRGMKEVKVVK
uniref:hypothetical protein n=1 Tax=Staphylococcus epidermidis TaxID=1282 RepID=UPI001642D681